MILMHAAVHSVNHNILVLDGADDCCSIICFTVKPLHGETAERCFVVSTRVIGDETCKMHEVPYVLNLPSSQVVR